MERGWASLFLWNLCLFLGGSVDPWNLEIWAEWHLGNLWPTNHLLFIGVYITRDLNRALESFSVWRDLSMVSENNLWSSKGRSSMVFWSSLRNPKSWSHDALWITTSIAMDLTAVSVVSKDSWKDILANNWPSAMMRELGGGWENKKRNPWGEHNIFCLPICKLNEW